MRHNGPRPPRRLRIAALITAGLLVLVLAGAGGGYLLLRTIGSPRQTAASYLADWQRGSYAGLQKVSVNVPSSGLAAPLTAAAAQLGQRRIRLSLGQVTSAGGSAHGQVHRHRRPGQRPRLDLPRAAAADPAGPPLVGELEPGRHLPRADGPASGSCCTRTWPARAPVLAADGTVLSSPQAIAESGSLALLTGDCGEATAAQAKALGAPYRAGDLIGLGGIEQAYSGPAGGPPVADHPDRRARARTSTRRPPASPPRPAPRSGPASTCASSSPPSQAVRSAATTKPVDLVAIQPSTGRVLAVVERPGGFDRALEGDVPARLDLQGRDRLGPGASPGCARPARFSAPARWTSAAGCSTTTTTSSSARPAC